MISRHTLLALALAGASWSMAGCGETKPSLYIRDLSSTWHEITVGITLPLDVTLSQAPPLTDKIYVDVDNRYKDLAEVDPMTLAYLGEKGEKTKQVKIKGLKAGTVTLTFTIRDTTQSRIFAFTVENEPPPGDFGPARDYGRLPDKGVPPDTTKPADKGAADKGATGG